MTIVGVHPGTVVVWEEGEKNPEAGEDVNDH